MEATILNESSGDVAPTAVPASCPMHVDAARALLAASEELGFPNHKRLRVEYLSGECEARELHLYYGEKEIVFDEPELFAFGEALAKHARFVASDAATWCPAADWPRAQEMLEHLLEEGILRRASELDVELTGARPSLLPPASCKTPRSWLECEAIAQEFTGEPLELGYLELAIPIYRVAHLFLDAEGRQVGEANVLPSQLRLDIPTDWRVCPHAGSRYRDDLPMNVTALKSMRVHWQQTMVLLSRIRAAFLRRFPHVAASGWTVGDLERLSSLVLIVPAYQMLREPNPVPNGALHPVLSSMYRITDGVRMTMHQMLFISINEATRPAEAPMSAAELYSYAERNSLFLSDYGVCAGPGALIEEFLRVLVDGEAVPGGDTFEFDPPTAAALQEIEQAFDYGLYGLQAHAVTSSIWSVAAVTYQQAWHLVQSWPSTGPEAYQQFRAALEQHANRFAQSSMLGSEATRASRDRAYANMFDNCALGLGSHSSAPSLAAALVLTEQPQHAQAAVQLYMRLQHCLRGVALPGNGISELTAILLEYLRREQTVVRASAEIARRINTLLERAQPRLPLRMADIRRLLKLEEANRRSPPLTADLAQTLGFGIEVSAAAITIAPLDAAAEDAAPLACTQCSAPDSSDLLNRRAARRKPDEDFDEQSFGQRGAGQSTCDGHGTKLHYGRTS